MDKERERRGKTRVRKNIQHSMKKQFNERITK